MRRLGALVALVVLLVGVPVGLVAFGDVDGLLSLDWRRLWTVRDDGSLLVAFFTLVGWAAWGIFALATLVEVLGQLSGRRLSLPGLGWAQGLVAALVVAAFAQGIPTVASAVSPEASSVPVAAQVAPSAAAPSEDVAAAPSTGEGPTYVVAPGDDLWSIAERLLGDGLRWREIFELNSGVIAQPDHIEAGWVLRMPSGPLVGDGVGGRTAEDPAGAATSTAAPVAPAPTVPVAPPATAAPTATTGATSSPFAAPTASSSASRAAERPAAPATTPGTPAPAGASAPTLPGERAEVAGAEDAIPAVTIGLGGLAAAAVLGAVAFRRLQREGARPVGQRFVAPSPAARRVETMLAAQRRQVGIDDLALVRRVVADHCRGRDLPHLAHALVASDRIELVMTHDAPVPPIGFLAQERSWLVPASGFEFLRADPDGPLAWPALVPVGESADGTVLVDLAEAGQLGVDDPDLRRALLGVLLATDGLDVVVAGDDPLPQAFAAAGVTRVGDVADALRRLPVDACSREEQLDRDLADAARPHVVVSDDSIDSLLPAVEEGRCAVVAPGGTRWCLAPDRLHTPWGGVALVANSLSADASAGLADLMAAASSTSVEPALWWATDDAASVTWLHPRPDSPLLVARAREDHMTDPPRPMLGLLGPIELRGARGELPPRAIKQCIEYAAYLLEHPGCTATQMTNGLLVAEGTRRSNMSRLRTWLGHDDDGHPYLPDAYSGRIFLSADVSSDWQRLQLLVGPGVNRVSPDSLAAALDLVRGAPLADAAPGQWVWAEPMRSDMVALIRDAAATLAQHALDAGDLDLVRWATARGLVASPADEILTVLRIRAEHRAGNMVEAERLVMRMAQHARNLGVDLAEETIIALQEVMEGVERARAVPR